MSFNSRTFYILGSAFLLGGCTQPSLKDVQGGSSQGAPNFSAYYVDGSSYSGSISTDFSQELQTFEDASNTFEDASNTYAGTISTTTGAPTALVVSSMTGTVNCSKSGISGATLVMNFGNGAGTATSYTLNSASGGIVITPNDNTCAISVTSITLGTTVYTSSGMTVTSSSSAVASYSSTTQFTNNSATVTSVYIAGAFSTHWTQGTTFSPTITFIYSQNAQAVVATCSASYGSVSLTADSNGGQPTIAAPSYCIGSSNGGGSCDASNNVTSFALTYDASYDMMSESLSLFLATGSQSGENYVFLNSQGNSALASTSSSNACGSMTYGLSNVSGCTFNLIDGLYNAASASSLPTATSVTNGVVLSWSATSAATDFLGYASATISSNAAQAAVRYLIIKHTDSTSGVYSYQLLILDAGHN